MTQPPVDLVVRGGTVVNADWSGPATVLVRQGRVAGLLDADADLPGSAREVDATGRLVIPGGVDPHTHIGQTLGEFTMRDDYERATVAALWGGTTTVVDFAIPKPGQAPADAAAERRQLATDARCDAALHACVVAWDDTAEDQLRSLAADGIRTVKLFTTYRDQVMANADTILRVLETLRSLGGLAYVHAEANHVIEHCQAEQAARGRAAASSHAQTRPSLAEAAAVEDVLSTAEYVGAPVYFVHQTTPSAVDLVRRARGRGVPAYSETGPHYLALDARSYAAPHPERFVCCPPLRDPEEVAALRLRARVGQVDTIGSDHCCFDTAQKSVHADDVRAMPNGLPGVETRLPVAFTELVVNADVSPMRFVALTSANPAKLNGVYPRKGVIAPGADADMVVLDPAEERVVRVEDMHMATDYTPYEGRRLRGWPSVVIVGGRVVLEDRVFTDPGAVGVPLAAQEMPTTLLC
ncbi:MAG: dihydropyrimidinase [Nocardioidaceae bacterium]